MSLSSCLLALTLPVLLAVQVQASYADSFHLADPVGDGQRGTRLDITGVTVVNGERAVTVEVSFAEVAVGDLGIRLQARDTRARDQVLAYGKRRSSGDRAGLVAEDGRQTCPGMSLIWDDVADTATLRLPATCFRDGDYGAIRLRAITEMGMDVDLAPAVGTGERWPWSRYVARG